MRRTSKARLLVLGVSLSLSLAVSAPAGDYVRDPHAPMRESVDYVLDPAAIESVRVEESDPRLAGPTVFSVVVRVSKAQARGLADITKHNVEKEMRILWRGEELFKPIIREEVRSGILEIPRPSRTQAEALAERLRPSVQPTP